MNTAVAILNWNGLNHLQTYLPSVVENSQSQNVEVYVIDNGSTDSSCNWIAENYPSVNVVKLDRNYGFAGGYNKGLAQINSDRYILLNSDVRVTSGWIEKTAKCMEELNLRACSPLILDDKNPEYFEYAGAAGGHIDKDGFMFCEGRIFDSFEKPSDLQIENKEVFWASGAALFIDSDIWREVGGLDEEFFAHMEEIDLCWRIKSRGHKVGITADAVVYHLGGGTLSGSNPKKVFLNFRNNLFLLIKNQRGFWPGFILRRLILDGIAGARFMLRGEFSFLFAIIKAHLAFYAKLGSMLRKRKKERLESNNPNLVGKYSGSIIVAYFIKGINKFKDLDKSKFT